MSTQDKSKETKATEATKEMQNMKETKKMSKEEKKALRRQEQATGGRLYIPEEYKEKGYYYRFVNVTPGNIENWKRHGAEIVTHEVYSGTGSLGKPELNGNPSEVEVGGGRTGSLKAVLIRMSQEDYEIMKELEQEQTDAQTAMLYGGKDPITGHSFIPKENLIGSITKENLNK